MLLTQGREVAMDVPMLNVGEIPRVAPTRGQVRSAVAALAVAAIGAEIWRTRRAERGVDAKSAVAWTGAGEDAVPEADRLDQLREVVPVPSSVLPTRDPEVPEADSIDQATPADPFLMADRRTEDAEAPEADALEQASVGPDYED
ncbi:MAG: hypothetical protein ACR2KK_21995 [Acidimicrobiales bacterium]